MRPSSAIWETIRRLGMRYLSYASIQDRAIGSILVVRDEPFLFSLGEERKVAKHETSQEQGET
jgi:hypothetical protein